MANSTNLKMDPTGHWLIAASYADGVASLMPVGADGAVGEVKGSLDIPAKIFRPGDGVGTDADGGEMDHGVAASKLLFFDLVHGSFDPMGCARPGNPRLGAWEAEGEHVISGVHGMMDEMSADETGGAGDQDFYRGVFAGRH